MMNVLALGLVLTSLLTAGFFTPSPEKQQKLKEDVIMKEGHRVVVVEYEKDDGNTKVSISPQDSQAASHEKGFVDKLSEKMEDVKEKTKEGLQEEETRHKFSPRELVCDAYGKCKHKIVSAIGRKKEAVTEKAAEAADKVYAVEEGAKEAVTESIGKVKDTINHKAHKASDKVQEAKESVKDSASEISRKARDTVAEKASGMKDGAKNQAERAEEKVVRKTKEAAEWVEMAPERLKRVGKKELSEILKNAREVGADFFHYLVSPERTDSMTGVLHLMGFAAAYGMCVWVSFASSYVLAGALPRHQFAMVQSKIYPMYFKAMAYSVGAALLGHLMGQGKISVEMFQKNLDLLASLVMIMVNLLCLEPRATKVMLERMKKEKEEGRGKEGHANEPGSRYANSIAETASRGSTAGTTPQGATQEKPEAAAARSEIIRLTATLQRLNSHSSFLNVLTLVSLTWHAVHLGQRLHTVHQC